MPYPRLLPLLLSLSLLAAGCGSPRNERDTGGHDEDVSDTADTPEESCTDEADPDIGTATELIDELSTDGWFFVYLEDMHTDHEGDGDYTFMMQKSPPVPIIMLGPGVTGLNLGPDTAFHDVETAPTEGYREDGTDIDSLVIGRSWQAGGSGSQEGGFEMSGNIYVLRTPGNRYGKLEVLHAENGEITMRAYLQEDPGSCNLRTAD